MMKFCNNCQRDVNAVIIERPETYNFKNEVFEIIEKVLVCECGEDLHDEELDNEIMRKLTDMYENRIGLSLESIKSIRERYGLSMSLFAKILGWSKSTVLRYESGDYIPSTAHMSILKQLNDNPESIIDHYNSKEHLFTANEQLKIRDILSNYENQKVEHELFNAININYKINERTIESGYKKFDITKVINMILFFTQKEVTKTKLMKLLFYSDFLYFKRNSLSISGMPYEKLPYGPVPKDHDVLLSSIEKNGFTYTTYEQVNEYTYIKIRSNEMFDETLFNEHELEILNLIDEKFKDYGSVAISDFSHKESGWLTTEDREIISYTHATDLQLS